MESLKGKLDKYKLVTGKKEIKIAGWQEYAIEVCQKFGITGKYKQMIFRHAKINMAYLMGKVENVKEKFGDKLDDKGNYLISLFRKKPPWQK